MLHYCHCFYPIVIVIKLLLLLLHYCYCYEAIVTVIIVITLLLSLALLSTHTHLKYVNTWVHALLTNWLLYWNGGIDYDRVMIDQLTATGSTATISAEKTKHSIRGSGIGSVPIAPQSARPYKVGPKTTQPKTISMPVPFCNH